MVVDEVVPLADKEVPRTVAHLSDDERKAKGKLAREKCPRDSHATFEPGPERPDPVALLESQAPSRVPELVPIRYGRMFVSPFTFYRGCGPGHGVGPGGRAAHGADRPDLWRRAPVQLRRLRLPRAPARLRLQRLRRDAARALGVGRQAPRGQHHRGRSRSRVLQVESRGGDHPPRPALSRGDAANGGDARTSRSGTPTWRSVRSSMRSRSTPPRRAPSRRPTWPQRPRR